MTRRENNYCSRLKIEAYRNVLYFSRRCEEYKLHRFRLECKIFDLKYIALLKVVCNQDLGIQPNIFHKIYFLHYA
ncbi:DUF3885 domain-containing protein [Lysinibacillus capsici]